MASKQNGNKTVVQQFLKSQFMRLSQLHLNVCEDMDGLLEQIEKDFEETTENNQTISLANQMDILFQPLHQVREGIRIIKDIRARNFTEDYVSAIKSTHGAVGDNDVPNLDTMTDTPLAVQILSAQVQSLQKTVKRLQRNTSKTTKIEAAVTMIKDMQLHHEKKMDSLGESVKSIEEHANRLDLDQAVHEEKLHNMKKTTDNLVHLRNMLTQLHSNVATRTELTRQMNTLQDGVTAMDAQINNIGLVPNVEDLFNQLLHERAHNASSEDAIIPSFSVKALSGDNLMVKSGNKIKFMDILSNQWVCYDDTLHQFTAPIKGTYLFSVSANTNSAGFVALSIVHNGNAVALCSNSGLKDEQLSTSIILELSEHDKVGVEAMNLTSPEGVDLGGGFSNFIGCRIN